MAKGLIVAKLGGSIITEKEKVLTPNLPAINRLAREIKQSEIGSLILIHGGGSYGHPIAKKYNVAKGYTNKLQLKGFSKTQWSMIALNKIILDALIQNEIPAVTVHPSSFIITKGGRIDDLSLNIINKLIAVGFFPLLHGDAVLDHELGYSILSGDQLMVNLAINLKVKRIVVGVDVDGLYTTDPKLNENARLITKINLDDLITFLKHIEGATSVDVTGGMYQKIVELVPALKRGITVTIINAKKRNRFYKALKGKEVKGTEIRRR